MELPTYSAVFAFEKRLYAVYDLELPAPVSLFQAGAFLAALAVVVPAMLFLGVGLSAASCWVFVVPPALAAYLASRPLEDGKRPHHWLVSQARYLTGPRVLVRLRPDRSGHRSVRVHLERSPLRVGLRRVWVPQRVRPRGAAHVVRGSAEDPGAEVMA